MEDYVCLICEFKEENGFKCRLNEFKDILNKKIQIQEIKYDAGKYNEIHLTNKFMRNFTIVTIQDDNADIFKDLVFEVDEDSYLESKSMTDVVVEIYVTVKETINKPKPKMILNNLLGHKRDHDDLAEEDEEDDNFDVEEVESKEDSSVNETESLEGEENLKDDAEEDNFDDLLNEAHDLNQDLLFLQDSKGSDDENILVKDSNLSNNKYNFRTKRNPNSFK